MTKYQVKLDDHVFEIEIERFSATDDEITVHVNGQAVSARAPKHHGMASQPEWLVIGGRAYEVMVDRELRHVRTRGHAHQLELRELNGVSARPVSGDGRVKAPIPGVVTQVLVEPGQSVRAGQPLLILEAMKMENQIRAPRDGIVASLYASAGRGVALEELLAEIT